MRSCERPLKRSARDAVPSSVSKVYFLSVRTQGNSCRRCASSSPRRVSAFSSSSSSSRAASHCSRVPILCSFIASLFSLWLQQVGVTCATDDVCHRRRESGNRRRRDEDQHSIKSMVPSLFLHEFLQTTERFVPSLRDVLEIGSRYFHFLWLELPDALAATP